MESDRPAWHCRKCGRERFVVEGEPPAMCLYCGAEGVELGPVPEERWAYYRKPSRKEAEREAQGTDDGAA